MPTKTRTLTGKQLNFLWGVGARHSLYREDGKWYHQLREFPWALFDAHGYVVFGTREDYLDYSPYLHPKQHLHVSRGISAMPNYVRVTEAGHLQALSHQFIETAQQGSSHSSGGTRNRTQRTAKTPSAVDMPIGNREITRILSETYRIIRDTQISRWVKGVHEHRCQICGDTIKLNNGQFYAEAHHIKPVGEHHEGPDVVENVICVCPKHHVLLDYGVVSLNKPELHTVPLHDIRDEYVEYYNAEIFAKAYKQAGPRLKRDRSRARASNAHR
jgi:hypothetical protein